jgi:t-SNARE complex subunit (syntaxin)
MTAMANIGQNTDKLAKLANSNGEKLRKTAKKRIIIRLIIVIIVAIGVCHDNAIDTRELPLF